MIAWTGLEMFEIGLESTFDFLPLRKWSVDANKKDGGILGVGNWLRRDLQPHDSQGKYST